MCVVRIPVSSSLEYIDTCREPPAGWRLALKTPRQQTALAAVGEVGGRVGREGMNKLKVLTEERQRCFAHTELTPVSSRIERHWF